MVQPGRKYEATNGYRYGFNGKENDNEVKGDGNQQDYGMRIYDPRLGKFLSVDPLTKQFAFLTPYAYAENDVLSCIDIDGLEKYRVTVRAYIPFDKVELTQVNAASGVFWGKDYAVHGEARNATYNLSSLGYEETVSGNEGYRVQYTFEIDFDKQKNKELSDLGTKAGTTIVYTKTEGENLLYQMFPMIFGPTEEWVETWRGKAETGIDNKYKLNIPENNSTDKDKNFVVSLKINALFPYHDFPFNQFPAIDANILLRFKRDANSDVTMEGTATLDGFPAFEGFIERIDKPNQSVNLFLDWMPKKGSDGINLFPILGDRIILLNKKDLPDKNDDKKENSPSNSNRPSGG